jgi:hypothetical protein
MALVENVVKFSISGILATHVLLCPTGSVFLKHVRMHGLYLSEKTLFTPQIHLGLSVLSDEAEDISIIINSTFSAGIVNFHATIS